MGTRRNFGVTVNDDRWEAFVKRAIELGNISLRVGILRGGTRYPAGWVGAKSRQADVTGNRFAALKAGIRKRSLLSAYRAKKKKTPGYSRRARKKRVDVAKVAAVVGFEAGKRPKLPTMWLKSMDANSQFVHSRAVLAMETALDGRTSRQAIEAIGARLLMAYQADVIRSGHRDTGLLLNTLNWELVDVAAQQLAKRVGAARRKARKLAKAAAK